MTYGVFVRLVSWPLGFLMMARRSPRAFIVIEGAASLHSLALPVMLMSQMGLVGAAVGFFWAAILHAILLVSLLSRTSGMSPGVGMTRAIFLSALAVCACQWLGTLSDHEYFGFLPTTLAATGCFGCYHRIIKKENETSTE
jgi:PST family polysaccharide transporter